MQRLICRHVSVSSTLHDAHSQVPAKCALEHLHPGHQVRATGTLGRMPELELPIVCVQIAMLSGKVQSVQALLSESLIKNLRHGLLLCHTKSL